MAFFPFLPSLQVHCDLGVLAHMLPPSRSHFTFAEGMVIHNPSFRGGRPWRAHFCVALGGGGWGVKPLSLTEASKMERARLVTPDGDLD